MSTAFPTAWPSPEPPWMSSVAMFVTDMFADWADELELAARARRVDMDAGVERHGHAELRHAAQKRVVRGMVERELAIAVDQYADGRRNTATRPTSPHARWASATARSTSWSGTPATANSRFGCARAELADPVVVRAVAVGDEVEVMERGDRVARTEEHALRRVDDGSIDAIARRGRRCARRGRCRRGRGATARGRTAPERASCRPRRPSGPGARSPPPRTTPPVHMVS